MKNAQNFTFFKFSRSLFFMMITSLLFVSCSGKKAGKTSTTISLGKIISGDPTLVDGGVMLIGSNNSTGEKFSAIYNGQVIDLRNGNWSFMAMAWQTAAFSGQLRCGLAKNINLSGGDQNVAMNLNTANCLDNFFGSTDSRDGTGAPHPLVFATCANEKCFWNEGGGSDAEESSIRGVAKSYQIFYPSFNSSTGIDLGNSLASPCHTQSLDNVAETTSTLNLPILNFPIPVVIKAYDDTTCSTSFDQYVFENGIRAQQPYKTWFNTDPVGLQNEIRLMSNVCRVPDTGGTFRYSTTGLPKNIHLICTENQFMNLQPFLATGVNQDDIYYLARSLDFSAYSPTVPIGSIAFPFKGVMIGNNGAVKFYV